MSFQRLNDLPNRCRENNAIPPAKREVAECHGRIILEDITPVVSSQQRLSLETYTCKCKGELQ